MNRYIPIGFTEEEADFMDGVPNLLSNGWTMVEVTTRYNQKFNTGLYSRQFHDRFDDYMKELAKDASEDETSEETPEEIVSQYLKDHFLSNDVDADTFFILRNYERWRQERDRKSLDEYADLMNLADRLMGSYNTIMDSIGKVFQ